MKTALKLFAIVAIVLFSASAVPQDTPQDTVTIPKSELTDQQKTELEQKDLQDKIDRYGKWVGVGHEIGVAVNEGLTAVTTNANTFAQTPVGKWTMFVIIFKVIGEKIIGYFVGLVFFLIGIPVWIWSYRRYIPHKYVHKVNYGPDGKKTSVEYGHGYGDDLSASDATGWAIGHWVILLIFIAIGCGIMFSGN